MTEAPKNARAWRAVVDTSRPSPDDLDLEPTDIVGADGRYRAGPRSVVVLIAGSAAPDPG